MPKCMLQTICKIRSKTGQVRNKTPVRKPILPQCSAFVLVIVLVQHMKWGLNVLQEKLSTFYGVKHTFFVL